MSNPTGSALTGSGSKATAKSKLAGKRPQYKAPTILTYTDDQLLHEMGPAKGTRASHTRRA